MGAHSRPRRGLYDDSPGRHRGELAPYFDADLSAAAGKTVAGLATAGAAGAVVVTGAGAAVAAPTGVAHAAAATYAAPTAQQLAELRQCESSGNYATNTGNGYYGAYQFDLGTWHGLGYSGRPDQASPATQDAAATTLEEQRGWQPWPACSAKLGLTTSATSVSTGATVTRSLNRATSPSAPASVSHVVAPAVAPTTPPTFDGTVLTQDLVAQQRADVAQWQQRMADRGWRIRVDGWFGPQSAEVAQAFASEKQVAAPAGQVTVDVWNAAWTAPVTP